MSLNSLIKSTLKPLNIPVKFLNLSEKEKQATNPSTWITYFEYNQNSAMNADDEETMTRHSIQVDVWSKLDYAEIVKEVKEKLKTVGFRRTFETEFYETDTEIFHKVLRFSYFKGGN